MTSKKRSNSNEPTDGLANLIDNADQSGLINRKSRFILKRLNILILLNVILN